MSCGHCVAAVRDALKGLSGVAVEQVAVGSATVSYDPGAVTPVQIAGVISDAGYDAQLKEAA